MSTTMTSIVIAILSGIGTFYTWQRNKALSLVLAFVTLIAGVVGAIGAFIATLSLVFKILPWIFIALGIWMIIRLIQNRNSGDPVER